MYPRKVSRERGDFTGMVARVPTNMSPGLISVLGMWENGAVEEREQLKAGWRSDREEHRGLRLYRQQWIGRKP